uniref:diphthine methyl ester synthase n=1 Tax=Triatoma dimidiata TaxID=72491 RepID=A0A0V0GCU4_TRIDM
MFYLIGIGLGDAKDITVKGLEIVKSCSRVYLESYTSILSVGKHNLEQFYGRELIVAERDLVEQSADEILQNADTEDVAMLVVGDPFSATTHSDIILRAKLKGIATEVVHNASILNAIGCCGLQLYNFGETVSIPFWTETWQPDSFFDKISNNKKRGLHTLCLLDIKVKEPTPESLTRKKKEFMPPHFMTAAQGAKQLMDIISRKAGPDVKLDIDENTLSVGAARIGSPDQKIVCCSLQEMVNTDLGRPLHSLVIVGDIHPIEQEYLSHITKE